MKAKITYQNYGNAILIFIKGETDQDALDLWTSIYNWGATNTEPRWVADGVIACWSTLLKLQRYFFNIHENRAWHNAKENEALMDTVVKAYHAAKAAFESLPTESFRSVNNNNEVFEFGQITAEKPDEDFLDCVTKYAFSAERA